MEQAEIKVPSGVQFADPGQWLGIRMFPGHVLWSWLSMPCDMLLSTVELAGISRIDNKRRRGTCFIHTISENGKCQQKMSRIPKERPKAGTCMDA